MQKKRIKQNPKVIKKRIKQKSESDKKKDKTKSESVLDEDELDIRYYNLKYNETEPEQFISDVKLAIKNIQKKLKAKDKSSLKTITNYISIIFLIIAALTWIIDIAFDSQLPQQEYLVKNEMDNLDRQLKHEKIDLKSKEADKRRKKRLKKLNLNIDGLTKSSVNRKRIVIFSVIIFAAAVLFGIGHHIYIKLLSKK